MRAALILLLMCDSQRVENCVTRALVFLARHQAEDGSWGRIHPSCTCRPRVSIETPLGIPMDAAVETEFNRLLEELAGDAVRTRMEAHRKIQDLGSSAVPLLQKSLRHNDPEVAFRCREILDALWRSNREVRARVGMPTEEEFRVSATGLGLLCFLGAGYGHYSKDQREDHEGRHYAYGIVVRKASEWLRSKQGPDGSFASWNPLAHAIATAAICEQYGVTAYEPLKIPAARAVAFLKTLQSADPIFLFWKGAAFHSAHLSELPDCGSTECGQIAEVLAEHQSPMSISGALIFFSCRKQPRDHLRNKIDALDPGELSPIQAWAVTAALRRGASAGSERRWQESLWQSISVAQAEGARCERGSWGLHGERLDQSLITTLYATLTMELFYRYNCAQLLPVQEK